mmetsp:Transcript_27201/g.67085  ORF Transcript_27201/g.67085 Transcript_27201/m.67085 type:complete len:573 (-) Transcript_27201:1863-3581(-)
MLQERGRVEHLRALVQQRVHARERELAQLRAVVDLVLERPEVDGAHKILLVHRLAIEGGHEPLAAHEGPDEAGLVVRGRVERRERSAAHADDGILEEEEEVGEALPELSHGRVLRDGELEREDGRRARQGLVRRDLFSQRGEHRPREDEGEPAEALGHHAPHALLVSRALPQQQRHHLLHVVPHLPRPGRALRGLEGDELPQRLEEEVAHFGLLVDLREKVWEVLAHRPHRHAAERVRRRTLGVLVRRLEGRDDDVLDVEAAEVALLADLPHAVKQQQLHLLRRGGVGELLDEALDRLFARGLPRGAAQAADALRDRVHRLARDGGVARIHDAEKLVQERREGAPRLVGGSESGEKFVGGGQRRALEEGGLEEHRGAGQDVRLHEHDGGGRVAHHALAQLQREVREVQLRVADERRELLDHLLVQLGGDARRVARHDGVERREGRLLERAIVLAQESGTLEHGLAADSGEVDTQRRLGDGAEGLEGHDARRLVAETLEEHGEARCELLRLQLVGELSDNDAHRGDGALLDLEVLVLRVEAVEGGCVHVGDEGVASAPVLGRRREPPAHLEGH